MATEGLKTIIGKALTDASYRQQLLESPEAVIAEFDLSEAEAKMLRNLRPDAFAELDMDVEERQSKSGLSMGFGSLMTGRDANSGDVGPLIDLLMNKYG
ncbi:MAG: hypothetical protein JW910_05880 [Anaerolineae bacterium]|nr:hypothetical protein [Anaerolineae bacterium]